MFGHAKSKFISHLPLDYRLSHTPGRRLLSDNTLNIKEIPTNLMGLKRFINENDKKC